jgi:hypothetical protein
MIFAVARETLIALTLGVLLAVAFVSWELRAREPPTGTSPHRWSSPALGSRCRYPQPKAPC